MEYNLGKGVSSWMGGGAYTVTFIMTEDCNLRCKYCYQVHKNDKGNMTFDIAKRTVDYLLDNQKLFAADAVIWDFIGGEPLLEIDLIDKICDYIKLESYKRKHKWSKKYRFSIGTNGILYDDPKVRRWLLKNKENCSVAMTIDGTKEKHDMQRVYKDGKGSYEDVLKGVMLWKNDFGNGNAFTKVTFGHDDIGLLSDSIIHLWNIGLKSIPANIVFEDVWEDGDDEIYYKELVKLADYMIEHDMWLDHDTSLFTQNLGYPLREEDLYNNYCGTGLMLTVDGKGNFYPCLRYMDFSLNDKEPIMIGNVNEGINPEKLRPFLSLSTKAQSDEECLDCPISQGCSWCQGNNYDESGENTIFYRSKNICNMHKARVRANNYLWNRLRIEKGVERSEHYIKKNHAYIMMSDSSVRICNYESISNKNEQIDKKTLNEAISYAENNFYIPVIIHDINSNIDCMINEDIHELKEIKHVKRIKELANINTIKTYYVMDLNEFEECIDYIHMKPSNLTINVEPNNIDCLSSVVIYTLKYVDRVNININKVSLLEFNIYARELKKIKEDLLKYFIDDELKEVNKITDIFFVNSMDDCGAGEDNITIGMDGNIYPCPGFYYRKDKQILGNINKNLSLITKSIFKEDNAPICLECFYYQCNRCLIKNKTYTGEYNTPSSYQCKLSSIEYDISKEFLADLEKNNITNPFLRNKLKEGVEDPFTVLKRKMKVNPYSVELC